MELVTMSKAEINRLEVMGQLEEKRMTQRAAAGILGMSIRQVRRLLRAYRREGAAGLVSKQRGKPSHHQLDRETVQAAIDLLHGRYAGFGPTLAHEKMVEGEGLKLGLGSVRKIMIEEGLWKAKKARKVEVHQMRERRASQGELEQMDGTDHDWFEGRGERCTLLVMIDDATGQLGALSFVPEESFFGYCGLLRQYLAAHGAKQSKRSVMTETVRIALSELLRERRARGLPILDLTESNPTRCGFTLDAEETLAPLHNPRALTYEPDPRGLRTAREAVVQYYSERGVQFDPDQIFLTASTSEAYSFVFRLLANPGDKILAPQPSYPLFDFLGGLNDVEVVPYLLVYDDGWQVDLDALAASWDSRTRAVLVVHPNNPTGSYVQRRELERMIERCRQNGAAIIADEVFADYAFGADAERVATHAENSEALTFTLSGLSKISALPQMKLGWVVVSGPQELRAEAQARLEVIADTYLSVSAPVALAAPRWLAHRQHHSIADIGARATNLRKLDELLTPACPSAG